MVMLCSYSAVAQNRFLSGVVVDAENKSIVSATVKVKGKLISSATDLDGCFEVKVPEGSVKLEVLLY
jgi:hypothetical protein